MRVRTVTLLSFLLSLRASGGPAATWRRGCLGLSLGLLASHPALAAPPPLQTNVVHGAVPVGPGHGARPAAAAATPTPRPPAGEPGRVPGQTAPVPQDLPAWCKNIAERLVDLPLAQCEAAGLQPGTGRSVRGVPLWFRDVLPAKGPARLRVLVLGGIHGDEGASVTLVMDWLNRAVESADGPIHWRMAPLVNPDGLLRKPATRVNARGVDLNRNFPTHEWDKNAQPYWVSRTGRDPRRYPGPHAMSEPETRWVQRQLEEFQPNLIVSVHAPYGVLDFDGPPPPPDKLGNLYLDQVGIYPGSLGNYGGVMRRVPVVTLELKSARTVSARDVSAMWDDLRGWIDRRLIDVAQQGPTVAGPPRKPS